MSELLCYWRLLACAALVLILDQASKLWVVEHIPVYTYHEPYRELIPGFLYLVHLYNDGAAWGMLSGYGLLLACLGIAALVGLFCFRKQLGLQGKGMQWIFGLLVGGIAGNLIDRLAYGHVVDFIDVHLPFSLPVIMEYGRFPAFNIADSAITVGVIAYILFTWRHSEEETQEGDGKAPPPKDGS